MPGNERFRLEPPIGIEPMTYALREARSRAASALAAPIAPVIALMAPGALELSGEPVHESVHAPKAQTHAVRAQVAIDTSQDSPQIVPEGGLYLIAMTNTLVHLG
jgi:hypothetical protein